ncbi:MAG: Crp/Fnr family transcriptional regulator [Amaricoccus sp.]|uniref:transcriptional regulator FnrL n=1 Tax=Amaricoccus sp. TaxID=1872485 RepID=UPI0039E34CCE
MSLTAAGSGQLRCVDCTIRLRAVCAHADATALAELERIKRYRSYASGQTITSSGDEPSVVGSVVEGVAQISTLLPDGRRQMVGLLLPSDFVGRPGRSRIDYDIVAATPVTLCTFRKADFERLLAANPLIERRLLAMMLDELDAAREWMTLLGRKSARERVASLVLMIARRDAALVGGDSADGQRVPLRLTRQAIADYLGLTIETVSRQFGALSRDGLVALGTQRALDILDLHGLETAAGEAV